MFDDGPNVAENPLLWRSRVVRLTGMIKGNGTQIMNKTKKKQREGGREKEVTFYKTTQLRS